MKKFVWFAVVVFPLGLAGCGGGGADGLMKDTIDLMNQMSATLEGVKDDASADAAVTKLKELGAKIKENAKKAEALKVSEAENKKLEEKYKPELEKATKRLQDATMAAVQKAPSKALAISGALMEAAPKK